MKYGHDHYSNKSPPVFLAVVDMTHFMGVTNGDVTIDRNANDEPNIQQEVDVMDLVAEGEFHGEALARPLCSMRGHPPTGLSADGHPQGNFLVTIN
jgi:hypothetical protein